MVFSNLEPPHEDVLAFKVKIDKVLNGACSSMLKLNQYMDLILELKELTQVDNDLSANDFDVIEALMMRAMLDLQNII